MLWWKWLPNGSYAYVITHRTGLEDSRPVHIVGEELEELEETHLAGPCLRYDLLAGGLRGRVGLTPDPDSTIVRPLEGSCPDA